MYVGCVTNKDMYMSSLVYLTKLPKWMFWKNVYQQETLTDCSLPWSEVEEIRS